MLDGVRDMGSNVRERRNNATLCSSMLEASRERSVLEISRSCFETMES